MVFIYRPKQRRIPGTRLQSRISGMAAHVREQPLVLL